MKNFYKGTLSTALCCLVLGIVLFLVGAIQGGFQLFGTMIKDNEFVFSGEDFEFWDWNVVSGDYKEKEYKFKLEEIDKLDLDIGASVLEIKYADEKEYHVQVKELNNARVVCHAENGTLFLESDVDWNNIKIVNKKTKVNKIVLTIPNEAKINEFKMALGAGSCTGKRILADNIAVEIGAGNLELEQLEAEDVLDLEVGAGNVEVDEVKTGRLDVVCEAGRSSLEHVITTGDIEVTCDAGCVYMGMKESEKSYNYDLECSLGKISVGDEKCKGMDVSKETDNDADKTLTAECNVGSIEIDFNK